MQFCKRFALKTSTQSVFYHSQSTSIPKKRSMKIGTSQWRRVKSWLPLTDKTLIYLKHSYKTLIISTEIIFLNLDQKFELFQAHIQRIKNEPALVLRKLADNLLDAEQKNSLVELWIYQIKVPQFWISHS